MNDVDWLLQTYLLLMSSLPLPSHLMKVWLRRLQPLLTPSTLLLLLILLQVP